MEFQSKVVRALYLFLTTLFGLLLVGMVAAVGLRIWTGDGRWAATALLGLVAAIVTMALAATIEE